MPTKRTKIEARLSFPQPIGDALLKMAKEREVDVNMLIAELVEVALIHLKQEPLKVEDFIHRMGESFVGFEP